MAATVDSTNTAKINQLVTGVAELRATLRICFAIIGIGFPFMISLLIFLTVQSFSLTSKLDRMTDQVSYLRSDLDRLKGRMNEVEKFRRLEG